MPWLTCRCICADVTAMQDAMNDTVHCEVLDMAEEHLTMCCVHARLPGYHTLLCNGLAMWTVTECDAEGGGRQHTHGCHGLEMVARLTSKLTSATSFSPKPSESQSILALALRGSSPIARAGSAVAVTSSMTRRTRTLCHRPPRQKRVRLVVVW